ncbi:MAG TPA: PA0069 family radical SAM protein [Verrucomicrobiae bacterium]|nr:PA0069 family radical SAM protein [Verrucomicrobiae bacterium]
MSEVIHPDAETPAAPQTQCFKGRGALSNPLGRFETTVRERDIDWNPEEDSSPKTVFIKDATQSIIAYNTSPDVGFNASINSYRGCEHGCVYCFARPTHEYLGMSVGIDFESRILVKEDAPELLRKELSAKKWKPQFLAMSGVTDCYQPIERKLQITRRVLQVLAEFRNPVGIITKNFLVTRDIDVLQELAKYNCVAVNISVTTLDATLTPKLEPRASLPKARLEAVRMLSEAGIPVGVLVAPCIPGITDHEMPQILKAVVDAGAKWAGYVMLRLPYGVKDLFEQWVQQHFPDRAEKVLNRIRSMRDGKLYDAKWGDRMRGHGIFAEQMEQMFNVACKHAGLEPGMRHELSTEHFRVPKAQGPQMELF